MSLPPRPVTAAEVSSAPLFASLSFRQCAELAARLDVKVFNAGQVLVREGNYGYVFYLLREGTVDVLTGDEVVATFGPDDFFGELAILGDWRRAADVVATTDGLAWCLFGTTLLALEREHPEIAAVVDRAARARRTRA